MQPQLDFLSDWQVGQTLALEEALSGERVYLKSA